MGRPPTCTPNVVNMHAQVFRYPKSSNRIEISQFVKFLWNFNWFQGPPPWGGGGGGGWMWVGLCQGVWGVPHTHAHMHMQACACARAYMYKHNNFMQMAAPIGKSWGIPLWHHCSCAHACACVCMHVHTCVGHSPNILTESHPHPPTPTPQGGGPQKSVKSQ